MTRRSFIVLNVGIDKVVIELTTLDQVFIKSRKNKKGVTHGG